MAALQPRAAAASARTAGRGRSVAAMASASSGDKASSQQPSNLRSSSPPRKMKFTMNLPPSSSSAIPAVAAPFEAWTTGGAIKKRTDIKSIMILGAGPIVIGQVRVREGETEGERGARASRRRSTPGALKIENEKWIIQIG